MQLSLSKLIVLTLTCTLFTYVQGQYEIENINQTQIIDFDGFTGSGFSATPDAGQLNSNEWEVLGASDGDLLFGGEGTSGDFARGFSSGSVGTGGIYSFDNGSGASLGFQPGATDFTPGSFTLAIENTTGELIEDLEIDYEIWVYNDQGRSTSFNFEHGADNVSFVQESSLDFVSPEASDVEPIWNKTSRSITISGVDLNDGEVYYLKWTTNDVGGSGSRDELALDNISIFGFNSTIPIPPSVVVSTNELEGFQQPLGTPSAAQSFTLSGQHLEEDLQINVTAGNYEVSLSEVGPYATSVTIEETLGEVALTEVFVRLNGEEALNPSNGEIQITSSGLTTEFVNLMGFTFVPSYVVDFEGDGETKTAYGLGSVVLSGLEWELNEVSIGILANDFKNGARSARLRGRDGSYMEMIEDYPNGVEELTFVYRAYGAEGNTDANQQPWAIEVSNDGGQEWTQVGDEITATEDVQTFSEVVNIPGNVRMRIRLTTEPGTTGDRRINIDDITLFDFVPTLNVSPNELSGFENIVGYPSAAQSFDVSGENIVNNVVLLASEGYEVSLLEEEGFSEELVLTDIELSLEETTIYVRLNGDVPASNWSGSITVNTQGADEKTVTLEGDILNAPELSFSESLLTGFIQELTDPSDEQSFEVSGEFLQSDVTATVFGEYEISLVSEGTFESILVLDDINLGELSATEIFVRLNGTEIANPENGYIVFTTEKSEADTVFLQGHIQNPVGTPTVIVSEEELTGFIQFEGTPSEPMSIEVWGTSITDNITLEVTAGDYEISLSEETGYTTSLELDEVGGDVDFTTIFIRLNGADVVSPSNGEITVSTVDADDIVISLEGEILPVPVIGATEEQMSGFSQNIGQPSQAQSFQLAAVLLTDDVIVSVTAPYEVSLFENSGYGEEISLEPNQDNEVELTTVFVRLNGDEVNSDVPGLITLSSTGAENWLIELNGEILPPVPTIFRQPIALSGFQQVLGVPSPTITFNVWGENLEDKVLVDVTSGDYEISLLPDEDFTTSIELDIDDGELDETTIYVRLNGEEVASNVQGLITLSSLDAENKTVTLMGDIVTAQIIATPELLTDFEQEIGAPSDEQTFTVEVLNLLEDEEVILSVTEGYEISLTSGVSFTNEIILTEENGAVEETTIYVRLNSSVLGDPLLGTVSIAANESLVEVELEGVTFVICDHLDVSVTQNEALLSADMDDVEYQWIDCSDDSPIQGANEQTFLPEESGSYAVIITDDLCVDTSDCFTVDFTNVTEFKSAFDFKLYPNPIEDAFIVEFSDELGNVNIEVTDAKGAVVLSVNDVVSGQTINAVNFQKGVYFVSVSGENGKDIIKVVK